MMTIYLRADGATGNVSTQGYENWIQLRSFQFGGISQAVQQRTGNMRDRVSNGANFGLVYVQKFPDSSTPFWFSYAHSTQVIPNLEIDFVTAGNPPFAYQKIKLTNAFVSLYNQEHAQGNALPIELLSLGYDTLEISYIPRSADNIPGNPIITGFNVSTGVKM